MYETVIGLETHVQLQTASKAFCPDSAAFGGAPNTHTSVISLAHPGALPRVNKTAVEYAVRLGLALGCTITRRTSFDRKNYFYADLPKGFQTTQDRAPICVGGAVRIQGGDAKAESGEMPVSLPPSTFNFQPSSSKNLIRIHHIHLEEDAGKSTHDQDPLDSLIDLNRAGVPLLEIVSEPDLRSAEEVVAYMETIRRLVRWIGISDGNMEEGSLRCDVNVSVRRKGDPKLGKRCEIKNVNSMRFARRAVEFETKRQIAILENGGTVEQETRGFDAEAGTTYPLREKEDAHDYRYFPEPDLPPLVLTDAHLAAIATEMPPLPDVLEQDFKTRYGLSAYDAELLTQERETAFYFLELVGAAQLSENAQIPEGLESRYKSISKFLINKLLPWSAETGKPPGKTGVSPACWNDFLVLIESGQLSASAAYQRLFPALLERPTAEPAALAAELNLIQSNDADFLAQLVDAVLARFPDKVQEYQKGKKGLIGFFMGEVMKQSKGKAEPQTTTKLLQERLGK